MAPVLGGFDVIGVVARQFIELLAFLGAGIQIGGLLFGNRHLGGRFALDGDDDLAEEYLRFLAHELRFVVVVVLLRFGFRHGDVARDLLADDALGEHLVLHLELKILVAHARVFADEGLKLIGVGDLLLHLDFGKPARDFGVDIDVEVLALLHEEQGVDLFAQRVSGVFVHRLLEAGSTEPLALGLGLDLDSFPGKFAAGDDVAVDFGGDLFDHLDVVRRGANRESGRNEYYKPTKHSWSFILAKHRKAGATPCQVPSPSAVGRVSP